MNNIVIQIADVEMTFAVETHDDQDHGAPWDECDGHGPVTGWLSRDKRPDELVLNSDRGQKRFYNFKEACAIALRDGWGSSGCSTPDCPDCACVQDGKCLCIPSKPSLQLTKRQKAAKAAMADFEYLRAWCNDEWSYVGVEVTLLDSEGNPTEVRESVWGVESNDNLESHAWTLADDLAHGLHTRFEPVTQTITSYKMI